MRRSTRIIKVDRRGARATIVTWRLAGQKGQIEVQGGMPAFRDWINEQIRDNDELLVAIGLKWWLVNNPGSTDFSSLEGKTITIDFQAAVNAGLVTIT